MKLNEILSKTAAGTLAIIAGAGIFAMACAGVARAGEDEATPHYPLKHPKQVHWSFAGPFGHWDQAQLQRGFKVYRENCSGCHSLELVAFRNLHALGYNEDQIKAIAAEYDITDGPNADGEMFERPGVPADRFPGPYANAEEAAASNNGAVPPGFSLLAKARAPERGFPTFIFDIFTMYAENGPDYIYSLLTGYEDPPEGSGIPDDANYNPYFVGGETLAMAAPLSDDAVDYDDGSPQTVDQYARDVAAFMMWAAEPTLVERKSLGFKVMLFLLLLAALLYLTKKKIWSAVGAGGVAVTVAAAGAGTSARAARAAPAKLASTARTKAPAKKPAPKPPAKAKAAPAKVKAAPAKAKSAPAKAKKASAPKKPGPERLSKPRGKADDLKMINGVGPKLEKTLNGLGFWHFSQIAKWTRKDVAIVDDELSFKGRIDRDDWIRQAKALAKGGRDEYVRVFGKEPR